MPDDETFGGFRVQDDLDGDDAFGFGQADVAGKLWKIWSNYFYGKVKIQSIVYKPIHFFE